jgi:hypothetical protein
MRIIALLVVLSAAAQARDFDLYYLGGQSNMDGYGYVNELAEEQRGEIPDVWIFHGNTTTDAAPVDGRGIWSPLRAGHGVGFTSDGVTNQYSDRFGVELSLALALRQARPDRGIAIIKYSRGGTAIAEAAARHFGCWEPDFRGGEGEAAGINQYDHFLATVAGSLATPDIDGDGTADRLVPAGIVWMQGESDAAFDAATAEAYEANLKRLMDLIRASLHSDDLPVVIGRISDSGQDDADHKVWDFGEEVRAAQAAFVEQDESAALVTSTDDYGYSDPWHYDTAGYLALGTEFARALLELQAK